MRISTVRLPLLAMAIAILVASCSDTSTSIEEPKTVSELISKAGEIPVAPARSEVDLGIVEERATEGGERYVSKSQRRRLQNRFEELIAFGASADVIYPGSILQGKSLIGGQLTPISAPIKAVTLTLQGGASLNVDSPSYAAIDGAIVKLAMDSKPNAADLKYFRSSMYSTESSFLNMGLDVDWLIGSIRGKFESQRGVKRSSTLLYMKQVYFKVVCSKPDFTDDVTVAQLTGSIGTGNPPCYISSVDYGRIFLIRVTADTTQEVLDNAIQASYGMFSGSGGFGNLNLNVTTTFDAIILGGSANGAANAVTKGSMDEINQLIRSEAKYSPSNPSVPIAYTVRHMGSQAPVVLGASTEYTIPSWEKDPATIQRFTVELQDIFIQSDCDFGTAGDGDFYYYIVAKDQAGKIIAGPYEIAWNRPIQRGDGSSLPINETFSIVVPKEPGSGWRLEGYVRDNDSNSDPDDFQEMGAFNLKFEHPWSEDFYNVDSRITLSGSSSCQGRLNLRITKH